MNRPPGLDLLELDLEEDDGVLAEGAEHEDDAGDHPRLDRRQTLGLEQIDVQTKVTHLIGGYTMRPNK